MITDAELKEALDADIVMAIRTAAKEVTGGNCTFADDDAALLGRLALRAVKANLIWGFDWATTRNLERVRDGLEPFLPAQGMAPEGRGREGGHGSSELPSPVANGDAPKGESSWGTATGKHSNPTALGRCHFVATLACFAPSRVSPSRPVGRLPLSQEGTGPISTTRASSPCARTSRQCHAGTGNGLGINDERLTGTGRAVRTG